MRQLSITYKVKKPEIWVKLAAAFPTVAQIPTDVIPSDNKKIGTFDRPKMGGTRPKPIRFCCAKVKSKVPLREPSPSLIWDLLLTPRFLPVSIFSTRAVSLACGIACTKTANSSFSEPFH